MQTAKVIFATNYKPFSLLIMLFSLSRWSHCAILDGQYVIDATLSTGVRRIKFSEWVSHYSSYEIVEMPVTNKVQRLEWARSRVGKKYDPLGILSLILRKNHEERDKWFCSEFVAEYLGIVYKVWRLSPQFLRQLSKVIQGWIV